MCKVLVLVEDYTNLDGKVALHYVHTRNLEYIKYNIDVTVLSFRCQKSYVLEGIKVITFNDYLNDNVSYDQLILHAPNLKNHYKFLMKYHDRFDRLIFFYHGHEVLKLSEMYPPEYDYVKQKGYLKVLVQNVYDSLKFRVWNRFIRKYNDKITSIFVSEWMLSQFEKYVKLNRDALSHYEIIYNSVGIVFEENSYTPKENKYDFVTIRSNLDVSKYALDVVYELAKANPQYNFAIVGRGSFFNHHELLSNITWINTHLNHRDMLDLLNSSKFALFPTRVDSQGVIACEMITYGLPLITSDISVSQEIFGDLYGAFLIDNDKMGSNNLKEIYETPLDYSKIGTDRYLKSSTINKEIELIKKGV